MTWWTGHVGSYDELLLARSLMGISEAFYIPAALALIADYHAGPTRSRAVGLHQMAIYCGVIFGVFAGAGIVSIVLVLLVRPRHDLAD